MAQHQEVDDLIELLETSDDPAEKLALSTEEHLVVKRTLADMLELDPDDERFDAK